MNANAAHAVFRAKTGTFPFAACPLAFDDPDFLKDIFPMTAIDESIFRAAGRDCLFSANLPGVMSSARRRHIRLTAPPATPWRRKYRSMHTSWRMSRRIAILEHDIPLEGKEAICKNEDKNSLPIKRRLSAKLALTNVSRKNDNIINAGTRV